MATILLAEDEPPMRLEDAAFRRYPRQTQLLLLVLVGVIEHFGYRQLTAWRCVRAFWGSWRGDRRWGRWGIGDWTLVQ